MRKKRVLRRAAAIKAAVSATMPSKRLPVNEALLAPNNSYGVPDFVSRGYYTDLPFRCVDCGKEEIWTGSQQKWWYEVAKGFVYSTAVRCRSCRRRERERQAETRQILLSGMPQKARKPEQ